MMNRQSSDEKRAMAVQPAMPGSVMAAAFVPFVLSLSGALYLTVPPSPDQFALDYLGWRVLSGAAPYVDFVDTTWPGSFWLHALSTFLFGNEIYSCRILDFLVMVVGLAFLADLLRRTWGKAAALWVLFLYPVLYISLSYWFAGQRDIITAHLIFICLWADHIGWTQQRIRWQILAGVALGLATLVKPTACFAALAFIGLALTSRRHRFRSAIFHSLTAGGGAFATLCLALAAVLLQGSSLTAIWEAMFLLNTPPYRGAGVDLPTLLKVASSYYFRSWHWIGIGALLTVGWFFRQRHTGSRTPQEVEARLLFPIMWGCGFLSFIVQARGFPYHLGICFAATVALLCIGLGGLSANIMRPATGFRRVICGALICIVIAGAGKKLIAPYCSVLAWALGRSTWQEHLSRYPGGQGLDMQQVVSLASRLQKLIPPEEPVLVWSLDSSINFLAKRIQPTRFYYYPLLVELDPALPLTRRWTAWFQHDLENGNPRICVVSKVGLTPPLASLPESVAFLRRFLAQRYTVVDHIQSGDDIVASIFVRKGSADIARWRR